MQLTKLFNSISLVTAVIAAPSVPVKRTKGDANTCGQQQTLSCCDQGQSSANPFQVLLNLLGSPALPIVAPLLFSVTTQLQTGCTALVTDVQCTGQQSCCVYNAGSGSTNTNTDSGGLINIPIANNDPVFVCVPVGSVPIVIPTTGN